MASFSDAVREWTDKQFRGKKNWNNLQNIIGIEIGDKLYNTEAEIDFYAGGFQKGECKESEGYINAGGLEIDTKSRQDLEAKKGEIPFLQKLTHRS